MTSVYRRDRGTSLLELVIATSVMLLLLGIGLPRMARMRAPYAIDGAARQIQAAVQVARQRAIMRSMSYRVIFNVDAQTYTIERNNAGTWETDVPAVKLPAGVVLGTLSPGNPVFSAAGRIPAQVTVPLSISGAHSRTVTINVLGKTTIS